MNAHACHQLDLYQNWNIVRLQLKLEYDLMEDRSLKNKSEK